MAIIEATTNNGPSAPRSSVRLRFTTINASRMDELGDALDHARVERRAGPDRPFDVGMPITAAGIPGNTRKDARNINIMATPCRRLLVAVAGLAAVVATSGNALADDISAVVRVPAELMQWHSGLSGTSDSRFKPERNSTPTAIDPEDFTAYLAMHGAAGLRYVAEDRFDHSRDAFDAPISARKSARDAAGIQSGSAARAR
jgi:hypothetical protein